MPCGGVSVRILYGAQKRKYAARVSDACNASDVDELSSEITKGLEIIPVSQMEEVLKIALMRTRRKKDGN